MKEKFCCISLVADLTSLVHEIDDESIRFLSLLTPMNRTMCKFQLTSGTSPNGLNLPPAFFLVMYPAGFDVTDEKQIVHHNQGQILLHNPS